jgi:hypothetical protein
VGEQLSDRLRSLLKGYAGPSGTLGGGETDRAGLHEALDSLLKNSRAMLWLAVAMAVLLFVAEFIVALLNIDNTKLVAGMAGAMGLTGAGAIDVVRRIAREMAQTHLLIVLCNTLDAEALKPVVAALARKL